MRYDLVHRNSLAADIHSGNRRRAAAGDPGSSQKQGSWLVGAVILCMAAVAVFFVEKAIFTEAERVEQNVLDLTAAFQRKDRERTLSFFSLQAPDLRDMAVYALNLASSSRTASTSKMSRSA